MSHLSTPPRVLIHPADQSAGAYYRTVGPSAVLRQVGHAITLTSFRYLTEEQLRTCAPDVVVFQRQYEMDQIEAIRDYRKVLQKRATFIYEIDDLLWDVPSSNPAYEVLPKNIKSRIREIIKLCDAVVVSTEPMAKAIRSAFGATRIRITPNCVPQSFVNAALEGRREAQNAPVPETTEPRKIRVGWAGGISHAADLDILVPVIRKTLNEFQWVFTGMMPPGVEKDQVEWHDPVELTDYPKFLGGLNLDIAVAPLVDNAFNACKSNLRLLEYGAAGFPVIASPVAPYLDVKDVIYTDDNNPESWLRALREAEARGTVQLEYRGEAMHAWVKENFILEKNAAKWAAAWAPRKGEFFTPSSVFEPTGTCIVGEGQEFETFHEASANHPGANLLYLRKGSQIDDPSIASLAGRAAGLNAGAVLSLHNEGVYPTPGQFIEVPEDAISALTDAAMFLDLDPVNVPYPSGPAVLLTATALARIGLPDIARFGNVEAAIMDWGVRAMEAGHNSFVIPGVFVAARQRNAMNGEIAQGVVNHLCMWMPYFGPMVSGFGEIDAFADVRHEMDLVFYRQNYTRPQNVQAPEDYEIADRVLLINGTNEDADDCFKQGELAYCATLSGHYLALTYPRAPNAKLVDLRRENYHLLDMMGKLAVTKIVFRGIAEGTLGSVGFLASIAELGIPVELRLRNPEEPSVPTEYIDGSGWTKTWERLLAATAKKETPFLADQGMIDLVDDEAHPA